jgi:hypothetical protein
MLCWKTFDFLFENEIRLRGHRIGIEDVLYEISILTHEIGIFPQSVGNILHRKS